MNIAELLRAQSVARPQAVAIVDLTRGPPRSITFAELDRLAGAFAQSLRRAGLGPGQAVLVLHPMSTELYVALFAIAQLGMLAALPDPSGVTAMVDGFCATRPPEGLIASPKARLLAALSPTLRRIPVKVVLGRGRESGKGDGHIEPCADDTPLLLTLTSGSTGSPKAVVRTHGFLLAQHRVLASNFPRHPGEIDLTALPVFVAANLASGAASVIPRIGHRGPWSVDPKQMVEQIRTVAITSITAGPGLLEQLVSHCLRHGVRLPNIRRIFTGGAPVWPRLLADLQKAAPDSEIVIAYGSTEAEPISRLASHGVRAGDLERSRAGGGLLVGEPVPQIRLRIMPQSWGDPVGPYTAPEFDALCVSPGQAGEIVVAGVHVLPGYLDGDGDRDTKVRVGGEVWHRTGDVGYLDERDRLWLLARASAVIRDNGGMIFPLAVECAVSHHRWVRRSAVARHEGKSVLFVELARPAGPSEIDALRQTVAWSGVDEVRTLKSIPTDRRHNAKVDYSSLYRMLGLSVVPRSRRGVSSSRSS